MLLTANPLLKGEQPLLIQRLKPQSFSEIILSPRINTSPLSSSTTTVALFKSKAKAAPAKKVFSLYSFSLFFGLVILIRWFLQVVVKEKPKVEDGIFGTSGGIGFTKQNELFVGRVAMIGFAVSFFPLNSSSCGYCYAHFENVDKLKKNK